MTISVEYFPISAFQPGEGIQPALTEAAGGRMPGAWCHHPEGMVRTVADALWAADLVREELDRVQDESPSTLRLPSGSCRPRDPGRAGQKGIGSSGRGGPPSKKWGQRTVGDTARGAYLELFVRVEKRWQHREDALDRLGF